MNLVAADGMPADRKDVATIRATGLFLLLRMMQVQQRCWTNHTKPSPQETSNTIQI